MEKKEMNEEKEKNIQLMILLKSFHEIVLEKSTQVLN